jgi:hypothetical protein
MQPSPVSSKPDYVLLAMAHRAGMISNEAMCNALGIDMLIEEVNPSYEEKRDRVLEMCRTEGFDMSLHNDIVAELLQYMSGDDPAFGNVVGEIYMQIESNPLATVSQVTFDFMSHVKYASPWNNK